MISEVFFPWRGICGENREIRHMKRELTIDLSRDKMKDKTNGSSVFAVPTDKRTH